MKKITLAFFLFWALTASAQRGAETQVAAAVQRLNEALLAADSVTLVSLAADALSYGHSNGRVEDKSLFVHNAVSGAFKFQSLATTDQTIAVVKRDAIVRHLFTAKAMNNGAPVELKLMVLQVWQKQKGQWKLLARQGAKL